MSSAGKSTLLLLLLLPLTAAVAQAPMHQVPVRLELDKAIVEVTRGADVTYTVTLKNGANQPAAAQADMKIDVLSPFGMSFPVVISQGQPSTTFHIKADQAGILRLQLKAPGLPGTSSLIVVKSSPALQGHDQSQVRFPDVGATYTMKAPKTSPPVAYPAAEAPRTAMKVPKSLPAMAYPKAEAGRAPASTAAQPPQAPSSVTAAVEMASPSPPIAVAASPEPTNANHLEIFLVENDPVAQDPTDHRWRAHLHVAALSSTQTVANVDQDLPVHLESAHSQLAPADMTMIHAQQSPLVVATADAPGLELVRAFATGMPVADKSFSYASPSATKIKLYADPLRILSDGHTSASVQACLADYEDNPTTDPASDHTIDVNYQTRATLLNAQLKDRPLKVVKGQECSARTTFSTFGHGRAVLQASASGLQSDVATLEFFLPKSLLIFSALGGLLGGFARTLFAKSLASKFFAHLWRNLVLGVILGFITYLLFLFGALSAIPKLDIKLGNVPVQSGLGAFVLGFVGGIVGRSLWPVPEDEAAAPPAAPPSQQAKPARQGE